MRATLLLSLLGLLGCDALWNGFRKPHIELNRPSRSSAIAIADDDSVVALVNPDDGSLSLFDGQGMQRTAVVATGSEPWSVVIHPDRDTAFVANRGSASVVKITGLQASTPAVVATVPVGSEPTGLALSPTGAKLFVAEFAESSVAVIDTRSMQVVNVLVGIRNPRVLAVTNNNNGRDDDELLVVPEFYGVPQPPGEAKGDGRFGRVQLFSLADFAQVGEIRLAPLRPQLAGFGEAAAPNQLGGIAIAPDGRVYVTAIAASPEPPLAAGRNVNPVVFVADLAAQSEVRDGLGTLSLAQKIQAANKPPLNFAADPVDIDFVPTMPEQNPIAYVVSRGGNVVLRVLFDKNAGTSTIGSTQNDRIDVIGDNQQNTCQNPIGGVTANTSQRMFLNCWTSGRLAVLNLPSQSLASTVVSSDSQGRSQAVVRGRRAFLTARGRFSQDGWSSCASCHPDGLSDGITWVFSSGPRQSPSLDGAFSHGAAPQQQRSFNWTANADEVHDFERLVRQVMGGKGAITTAGTQADCGDLGQETQVPLSSGDLVDSAREAAASVAIRCSSDWDDIGEYLRSIRPPLGLRRLDPESVMRGAQLFDADIQGGACTRCHGGVGWTVSRLFYTPSKLENDKLTQSVDFRRPSGWPTDYNSHSTKQLAPEPPGVSPLQVACAIRNVGTFGPQSLETADTAAVTVQGSRGYNVPSLYGLALSAPYLHSGQAGTLDELFTSPSFSTHRSAGAANFSLDNEQDRRDLISFLLSIDAAAKPLAVPGDFGAGCQAN